MADLSLDEIEMLSEASDAQLLPKAAKLVTRHHPEFEVRDMLEGGTIVPAKTPLKAPIRARTVHRQLKESIQESSSQTSKAAEPGTTLLVGLGADCCADLPVSLVPPNGKIMSDSALKMVPEVRPPGRSLLQLCCSAFRMWTLMCTTLSTAQIPLSSPPNTTH